MARQRNYQAMLARSKGQEAGAEKIRCTRSRPAQKTRIVEHKAAHFPRKVQELYSDPMEQITDKAGVG